MSWTMQDISPCSVFVRAPLPPCQVKRYKCIGQIEASTSPRAFHFFENCCSNSPLSKPKCRSNAPTPGTFHRHMNDRRTENTPSVVEQNIVACEQALLFGQAKRTSRERTSEGPILCHSRLRRSLTRSRETCFARPNRRACSQAINTANNSHQYNKDRKSLG